MSANHGKTKKTVILIACAIGVLAFLAIGMTSGMAADTVGANAEIANANVEFVNPDSGVILLEVGKNWKISGIDPGDKVEIVVEKETPAMRNQRPRRWRMRRFPYGGPSTP